MEALVRAGATMVGKTHTDELTRGILGVNAHYGTPLNPRAPGRVPGGSSSGSAAAVAGGLVDFALGSDTGGSVRIPASFCGLYGLRPSHGRIPLDGMLLQAPSYDSVGWFARDPGLFAQVGSVLLQTEIGPARPRRLVVAADAFEAADESVRAALQPVVERLASLIGVSSRERLAPTSLSDWAAGQRVRASSEAWEVVKDWIDRMNPRLSFQVAESCLAGRSLTSPEVAAALADREKVIARMRTLLAGDTVVCLPTAPIPAPPRAQTMSERRPPVLTYCPVDLHCRNDRGASNQPALGRGGGTAGGAFPDGGSGVGRDADRFRPRSRRNAAGLIESSGKHTSGRLQSLLPRGEVTPGSAASRPHKAWHSYADLSHFNQPGTPPLPVDCVKDVLGLFPDRSRLEGESQPSRQAKADAVGGGSRGVRLRSGSFEEKRAIVNEDEPNEREET